MANSNPPSAEITEILAQIRQKGQAEGRIGGFKQLPSKRDALTLLKQLNFSSHIIHHQQAVMRKALDLAHNIKRIPINRELICAGALLHDIGRLKSHELIHTAYGGDILRELGYPEELARIAETHSLGGMTSEEAQQLGLPARDYIPRSLEEKIVCLADKFLSGTDYVNIDQRFKRWLEKYGRTPFLEEQMRRVKVLEEEILHLIYD
jgi:uncharacterized protein